MTVCSPENQTLFDTRSNLLNRLNPLDDEGHFNIFLCSSGKTSSGRSFELECRRRVNEGNFPPRSSTISRLTSPVRSSPVCLRMTPSFRKAAPPTGLRTSQSGSRCTRVEHRSPSEGSTLDRVRTDRCPPEVPFGPGYSSLALCKRPNRFPSRGIAFNQSSIIDRYWFASVQTRTSSTSRPSSSSLDSASVRL